MSILEGRTICCALHAYNMNTSTAFAAALTAKHHLSCCTAALSCCAKQQGASVQTGKRVDICWSRLGATNLLIERGAVCHDLGLSQAGCQVQLIATWFEFCPFYYQALVQRISLCTEQCVKLLCSKHVFCAMYDCKLLSGHSWSSICLLRWFAWTSWHEHSRLSAHAAIPRRRLFFASSALSSTSFSCKSQAESRANKG